MLHLAYAGCRVTLSLFALKLDASPFTVGMLLSLFALVPMTFSVPVGRLIDRVGVRRPIVDRGRIGICRHHGRCSVARVAGAFHHELRCGSGFILLHIAVNYFSGGGR